MKEDLVINKYEEYKIMNKINIEDLKIYENEQLLEVHKKIFNYIKQTQRLLFVGENVEKAIEDNNKLIIEAKNDLELVESFFKIRKLHIPNYGVMWKVKQVLKFR